MKKTKPASCRFFYARLFAFLHLFFETLVKENYILENYKTT